MAQEQDRLDEARTAFDAALRLDPSLIAALAARATLAFDAGDTAAAIEDLTRALEISDDPALWANRSLAYERAGRRRGLHQGDRGWGQRCGASTAPCPLSTSGRGLRALAT
ncbi:MAG: hypothetical protein ACT4NY_06890 [Pseudonocardiales bacterium]